MSPQQTSHFGILLVTIQFLILGYFVFFHPIQQPFGPQDMIAWTLVTAGIAIGTWALLSMRRGSKLRILPEPDANATLIIDGPYAFIRHPLYTALILLTFGLFLNYPVMSHFVAWSILFVTLNIKLIHEEKLLLQIFPNYTKYQAVTHKLFPFVY